MMKKQLLLLVFSIACCHGFAGGIEKSGRSRINRLYVISIGVSAGASQKSVPPGNEIEEPFFFSLPCHVCLADAGGMPAYFNYLRSKLKTIDTVISRQFINTSLPFDSVVNAFREVQQGSRPDDVFVFYYAGISWGRAINTEINGLEAYYAINKETGSNDPRYAFTLSQLKTLTDRIAAQRQLIIFDSGNGDAIQSDFYKRFFNDDPSQALFSKKERVILCPENYSGESADSTGVWKGDMFKVISSLPVNLNVFRLFDNKAGKGFSKNQEYKQFMQYWYSGQVNTMAQIKVLREQDYLTVLTNLPAFAQNSGRGNETLQKPKAVDSAFAGKKKVALLIASDTYQAGALWGRLRNAVKDAKAMGEVLAKLGYEIRPYYNQPQDDILNAISRIADESVNPYDQYVIYFAGHGYYDGRQQAGYIVCNDSKAFKDAAKPTATELRSYIDYTVLFRNLEQLNKVVMITDVCFGGTSMNSQLQTKSTASPDKNNTVLKNPYKRVLSSGVTVVDDFMKMQNGTASPHSPFATALLRSFSGETGSINFEKIYASIISAKLPVQPVEFYFGENVRPNEFVF